VCRTSGAEKKAMKIKVTLRNEWGGIYGTRGAGADAGIDGPAIGADECVESAIAGTAAVAGKPGGRAVSELVEQPGI